MANQYQTYVHQLNKPQHLYNNNYKESFNNNLEKNRPIIPKKPYADSILMSNNKKDLAYFNNNNHYLDKNSYQETTLINTRPVSQSILNRPQSGGTERRLSFIQAGEFLSVMDLQEMHINEPKRSKEQSVKDDSFDGSNSSSNYACPNINQHHQGTIISDGKATLSRKALKIAQKAQKLSIASIGLELSSSASALYSLFTTSDSNGNLNNYNNANNINSSMSSSIYSNNNIQIANLNYSYNNISVKNLIKKNLKNLNLIPIICKFIFIKIFLGQNRCSCIAYAQRY